MFENLHIVFGEATVGLLAFAIVTYGCWFWQKEDRLPLKDFIHEIGKVSQSLAVVVFFLIYGLGLIIHDISDSLSTQDLPRWSQGIPIIGEILPSQDRMNILFEIGNQDEVIGITPLGREVLSQQKHVTRLLNSIYDRNSQVDQFLECPIEFANMDAETTSRYVNSLYFNAKNWTYSHPNYFHEMEIIEQRIDFARSASITCFIGALFLLFSLLPVVIFRRTIDGSNALSEKLKNIMIGHLSFSKTGLKSCCILIIFLVALSFFSKWGFRAGSIHFDKRAFGYFYSYLHARDLYGTTHIYLDSTRR